MHYLHMKLYQLFASTQLQTASALGTLGCVLCLTAGGGLLCVHICAVAIATMPAQLF
jgi:hypothetical protein